MAHSIPSIFKTPEKEEELRSVFEGIITPESQKKLRIETSFADHRKKKGEKELNISISGLDKNDEIWQDESVIKKLSQKFRKVVMNSDTAAGSYSYDDSGARVVLDSDKQFRIRGDSLQHTLIYSPEGYTFRFLATLENVSNFTIQNDLSKTITENNIDVENTLFTTLHDVQKATFSGIKGIMEGNSRRKLEPVKNPKADRLERDKLSFMNTVPGCGTKKQKKLKPSVPRIVGVEVVPPDYHSFEAFTMGLFCSVAEKTHQQVVDKHISEQNRNMFLDMMMYYLGLSSDVTRLKEEEKEFYEQLMIPSLRPTQQNTENSTPQYNPTRCRVVSKKTSKSFNGKKLVIRDPEVIKRAASLVSKVENVASVTSSKKYLTGVRIHKTYSTMEEFQQEAMAYPETLYAVKEDTMITLPVSDATVTPIFAHSKGTHYTNREVFHSINRMATEYLNLVENILGENSQNLSSIKTMPHLIVLMTHQLYTNIIKCVDTKHIQEFFDNRRVVISTIRKDMISRFMQIVAGMMSENHEYGNAVKLVCSLFGVDRALIKFASADDPQSINGDITTQELDCLGRLVSGWTARKQILAPLFASITMPKEISMTPYTLMVEDMKRERVLQELCLYSSNEIGYLIRGLKTAEELKIVGDAVVALRNVFMNSARHKTRSVGFDFNKKFSEAIQMATNEILESSVAATNKEAMEKQKAEGIKRQMSEVLTPEETRNLPGLEIPDDEEDEDSEEEESDTQQKSAESLVESNPIISIASLNSLMLKVDTLIENRFMNSSPILLATPEILLQSPILDFMKNYISYQQIGYTDVRKIVNLPILMQLSQFILGKIEETNPDLVGMINAGRGRQYLCMCALKLWMATIEAAFFPKFETDLCSRTVSSLLVASLVVPHSDVLLSNVLTTIHTHAIKEDPQMTERAISGVHGQEHYDHMHSLLTEKGGGVYNQLLTKVMPEFLNSLKELSKC